MNFRAWKALAWGVVLESLRRKDLWVVAILGGLILIGAGALGIFGVEGLGVFIKDLASTVLGFCSTIVACLISTRLIPDEVKQRTLYPLLARPVSRLDLLIGKLIGAIGVAWISFLMLSAMTAFALLLFHIPMTAIMLQYMIAKMMGLALVCSVGLAFSTYMTPAGAATMTLIFSFCSAAISRALFMAGAGQPSMQWLFKLINGAFPQPHLYDFGALATYNWSLRPASLFLDLFIYLLAYGSAMVAIAWLKFRKQAL
jgi:ABC-type transport system involved in multi-copper enzyme maturation permease subunit